LTTVCLVLTGLAIGIPTAWAHHSVLNGSVACSPDGHAVVTWHLTNSETAAGSNRTEVVDTVTLTSGTLVGIGQGTRVGPQTANGIPTVSATSTYPGAQTGPVTLTIGAHWINADGSLANITHTDSASVTLGGACKTPSDPHATMANSCVDGGVKVVLANTGQTATAFDMFKNGAKIDTVAVAAGGSVTKTYAMAEDETSTFRAKADNYDSGNVSVTHDCTNPAAAITNSCSSTPSGVVFKLSNAGLLPVSFELKKNGSHLDTVAVSAIGSATKAYAMAEDEVAIFRAKGSNFDSGDVSITHNCTNPGALVANSCADGGAVFTLTNTGVSPESFDVTKGGAKIDTVTVAGGGTVTKTYAMAEDETSTFRAKTADGFDSGDRSITHNCTNPGAVVADSCSAGGAVFSLGNTGVSAESFVITKNGTTVDTVVVPAAATVTKTYAMAEDEVAVFRAKTADGFDSGNRSITHNCTSPGASVTNSCAAGGAMVALSNGGPAGIIFAVQRDGVAIENVAVAGFATVTKTYAMAEDATAVFRATSAAFDSGAISITHDCLPTAVLGVQFNAPTALPRTGGNAVPLALRGIALLLLGGVLVRFSGLLRRSQDT
jgi:hypothetical protein